MASYASLDQLKAQLGVPASDTRTDESLTGILEAVSRLIDAECDTQFYASDETLYYTPTSWHELMVDDILSVTSLATDAGDGTYGLIWAPTDYVLAPYNAATSSQPRPYWRIERARLGRYSFPAGVPRSVMATVRRGFCEIEDLPAMVEAVCLRESLFQAQANVTPYGMTAGDAGGAAAPTTVSLSKYSKLMLANFKRVTVAGQATIGGGWRFF
jgi:hypothetical protein